MVLGIVIDLSILSYPMLVIMKEQGVVVGRGEVSPGTSGEVELALGRRARRSQPSDVERGGASPRMSGEAEPALRRWARRSQPSDVERGGVQPSGVR